MDPDWTAYDKLIEYVTFDVTEYLHPGRNALGEEEDYFFDYDSGYFKRIGIERDVLAYQIERYRDIF